MYASFIMVVIPYMRTAPSRPSQCLKALLLTLLQQGLSFNKTILRGCKQSDISNKILQKEDKKINPLYSSYHRQGCYKGQAKGILEHFSKHDVLTVWSNPNCNSSHDMFRTFVFLFLSMFPCLIHSRHLVFQRYIETNLTPDFLSE